MQVRYAPISWFTNRVTLGADLTQADGFELFPKNSFGWYPTIPTYGNADHVDPQNDRLYTVDYLGNIRVEFGADKQISSDLSFGSQYIDRIERSPERRGPGSDLERRVARHERDRQHDRPGLRRVALDRHVRAGAGRLQRSALPAGGLRADRNSAFGSDVGTFYLPKFGASYVISEEPFWKGLSSLVPTMRLRAAYGTTGRSPSSGAITDVHAVEVRQRVRRGGTWCLAG